MIYLNYAGLSPTDPAATAEATRALEEFRRLLYSDAGVRWYRDTHEQCRHAVAAFLGADSPDAIAFTANASTAHYFALNAIDWQLGDTVLTTTHENPSILQACHALTRRGVATQHLDPTSPAHVLEQVESHIRSSRIRAIVASHVSHRDGRILPVDAIGALARRHDVVCILDGSQAAGHIPVNLNTIHHDCYFFPGHKWCRGPLGTGVLAVHADAFERIPALRNTGTSSTSERTNYFERGTHNIGWIAGLAAACRNSGDLEHRRRVQHAMYDEVTAALRACPGYRVEAWDGPHAPGILSFGSRDVARLDATRDAFETPEPIAAKSFVDEASGQISAIRLSWANDTPMGDVHRCIERIQSVCR